MGCARGARIHGERDLDSGFVVMVLVPLLDQTHILWISTEAPFAVEIEPVESLQ